MDREAIEEAIEVLEDASAEMLAETGDENYYSEAIAILRQELETEQEPVAWRYKYPDGFWRFSNGERVNGSDSIKSQALYTAPPKKQWVGLTKEDMPDGDNPMFDTDEFYAGMVWAEAKLKEKNT
jgi:hypothetical protein